MQYEIYILVKFFTEFTVMHLLSEALLKGKNKRNYKIKKSNIIVNHKIFF